MSRILALDVGEKTLGVAVSDPLGWTAQRLPTIRRRSPEVDLQAVRELVERWEVEKIVLGLPQRLNGSYGPEAEKIKEWGRWLAKKVGLPVVFWDERLSTVAAEKALLEGDVSRARRKKVVDGVAASLFLQAYLDRQKG